VPLLLIDMDRAATAPGAAVPSSSERHEPATPQPPEDGEELAVVRYELARGGLHLEDPTLTIRLCQVVPVLTRERLPRAPPHSRA
jgi:hypothetical protein